MSTPPVSAQELAARRIRRRILGGEYPPGSRLPAERKLAHELGVSRLTLRGALTTLASEGLVRAHPGSGVEVLDFRRSGALDLFTWLLAHTDDPPERVVELFGEVIHLRRVVALDTMVRAAGSATEEDVLDLEAIAAEQRQRVGDPLAYLEGDLRYQRRVLEIVGSTALTLLFNSLERVMAQRVDLVQAFMGPLEEHAATYDLVHQLLRHGKGEEFRDMAESALDIIETQGLERVAKALRDRAAAEADATEETTQESEASRKLEGIP